MKLSSNEALKLLKQIEKEQGPTPWIKHSKCVGNTAGRIAEALSLDVDKAQVLGYIHDIGRKFKSGQLHDIDGYHYLKELGYDEEYASVCLTHSYLNNDVTCAAGGFVNEIPFRMNYIKNHEYSIYEKIINLCDLMCKNEVMTIEKRMIDLLIRKGVHENTIYHIKETIALKEYFDDLLNANIYDLFKEIKDNL